MLQPKLTLVHHPCFLKAQEREERRCPLSSQLASWTSWSSLLCCGLLIFLFLGILEQRLRQVIIWHMPAGILNFVWIANHVWTTVVALHLALRRFPDVEVFEELLSLLVFGSTELFLNLLLLSFSLLLGLQIADGRWLATERWDWTSLFLLLVLKTHSFHSFCLFFTLDQNFRVHRSYFFVVILFLVWVSSWFL